MHGCDLLCKLPLATDYIARAELGSELRKVHSILGSSSMKVWILCTFLLVFCAVIQVNGRKKDTGKNNNTKEEDGNIKKKNDHIKKVEAIGKEVYSAYKVKLTCCCQAQPKPQLSWAEFEPYSQHFPTHPATQPPDPES